MLTPRTPLLCGLLAASIALLAGCTSTPGIALPDPKNIPKEKWSDALLILDAMHIDGQRDMPRALTNAGIPTGDPNNYVGDYEVGSHAPVLFAQTAAWVPANLAKSPQEAAALVLQVMAQARDEVYPGPRSSLTITTGQYAPMDSRAFTDPGAILMHRPIPFTSAATSAPAFIKARQAYGPIYVHYPQYGLDGSKNDVPYLVSVARMSKALPDWVYIYYPGEKLRHYSPPARVFNKGEAMYFVEK